MLDRRGRGKLDEAFWITFMDVIEILRTHLDMYVCNVESLISVSVQRD